MSVIMEAQVGAKLGLNPNLDLRQACADFYLLEALYSRTTVHYEQRQDANGFWRGGGGPAYPLDFGWDSKIERYSMEVQAAFRDKLKLLSAEFALYLSLACGGELRHAAAKLVSEKTLIVCVHYNKNNGCSDPDCCSWKTYWPQWQTQKSATNWFKTHVWGTSGPQNLTNPMYMSPADCGCTTYHHHKPTCKHNLIGCSVPSCCGHEHLNSCYEHKTSHSSHTKDLNYIREFLSNPLHPSATTNRSAAWDVWWEIIKDDPATAMDQCAQVFEMDFLWSHSFGGKAWATAAHLAADYYAGTVKPQTFVDRCWSLEHNNGCIFNKMYQVKGLRHILNIQAANNYDQMAHIVKDGSAVWLWTQRGLAETGRVNPEHRDLVRNAVSQDYPPPSNWIGSSMGCLACAWYYNTFGKDNPCNKFGVYTEPNDNCAYTPAYNNQVLGQNLPDDDDDDDDEPKVEHDGCAACCWYYWASDGMCDDPCGSGDTSVPDQSCAYYDEYVDEHSEKEEG